MSLEKKNIAIVGAGLVGSLLSIYFSKKGYEVTVFEGRGDMRKDSVHAGRSINLALSNRGRKAVSAQLWNSLELSQLADIDDLHDSD